ncbi:MAG: HesA/MoeB/ThiF family protein [Alphaproteobacteria bacterium]
MNLTEEQINRYNRNIILDKVGRTGQEKLLNGRVLIIGAGGLGSPTSLYLAAAGVGTIGVVDGDVIEISNLQRQIAHHTLDIGAPKVESAAAKMRAINPDVTVNTYQEWARANNIIDLIKDYDFILDCTDNFASKFLINDAAFFAKKPLSHAGVLHFEGQLMTISPNESACYRCVFDAPPPSNTVPAGVLGVLPGVIGSLQATEAIKFILGEGTLLTDTLLTYDALSMNFRKVKLKKNPSCKLCGDTPSITELKDKA